MSVFIKGNMKGFLNFKIDVIVRIGFKYENIVLNKMILFILGFIGKVVKWWLRGVKFLFVFSVFYKRIK